MHAQALTRAQLAALIAAKGYKPFAREKNATLEAGITAQAYGEAVAQLNTSGRYLKRSAITPEGRALVEAMEGSFCDSKLAALRPADYKRFAWA